MVIRGNGSGSLRRTKVPERSGLSPDDPYGGRHPASHERMAGQPWDASYRDGPPPWDIGRPQPAVMRLAAEGGFVGPVLDAGCGTGENALHIASLGFAVLGVDVAETALAIAREKAADRGIKAEFVAADALALERLGRRFATVLDCGLFHSLDADERRRYVASLASVTERDATVHVMCFCDLGPGTGPHPVSQEELKSAFRRADGWNITSIGRDTLETEPAVYSGPAWVATIERL
jgi:SAM-dependent methyltransferase